MFGGMPEKRDRIPQVQGGTPTVQGCAPLTVAIQPASSPDPRTVNGASARTVDGHGGSGSRDLVPGLAHDAVAW